MDVVRHVMVMRYVISALFKRPKHILATMVFGLIVLYLYSIAAFLYFKDDYAFEGSDIYDPFCSSMASCFKAHVDFGWSGRPAWNKEATSGVPMLYNAVFFFLINVILIAVITGIIIDTFNEMRERNDEIEDDLRDSCFICCQDRDVFENSRKDGFKIHIDKEHCLWNYIYLRAYLRDKPRTEYTGQEQFVQVKVCCNLVPKWV